MTTAIIAPSVLDDLRRGILPVTVRRSLIEQALFRTQEVLENPTIFPNPEDVDSYIAKTPSEKRLPDWRLVERALIDLMLGFRLAGNEGNLSFGELNLEYGDDRKARWFLGAYKQIFWRHHIMALEEVRPEAVDTIAKALAYRGFCTPPNSRGQGVGILVNEERLEILGEPLVVTEITNVQGIPELRPALVVQVKDRLTGREFGFGAVHLKSMLGGEDQTAPVRKEQIEKLCAKLGPDWKGILAGDWNFHMTRAKLESKALSDAGFELAAPADEESTQAKGGRIDGFYSRGMGKLVNHATRQLYKMDKVGRGFTDHALTRCQLTVRAKKSK